jgi:hypothetical protein
MSNDFEQRLRSGMEHVAVRPRPDLVKEAYRSYRGKRRVIRAIAVTGAAMAIAAGTAAGVAAATASPAVVPAQTTVYVLSHASSALATANRIMYTTTTTSFGPPSNTHLVTDVWDYGSQIRQIDYSASGQPAWESWVQTGPGKPTLLWVDYQHRTWEHFGIAPTGTAPRPSVCGASGALLTAPNATPAEWKLVIDAGLRCGLFHVTGHQRVDGIDAIKVTGGVNSGIMLWASPAGGITLWLDPHTYLPVQLAGTEAAAAPKPAAVVIRFRWLPPTQANLAQLTGTIPPGFHRTYPR